MLVTLIYLKKKLRQRQRWIDVVICLLNGRFSLQLPSCLPLVLLQSIWGRACTSMVINTCTQSFNLPYLSHVTIWLHCLIWVSFNLSCSRLESNEGRKRHIWVTYSVRIEKRWAESETTVVHLTGFSLFLLLPDPLSLSHFLSASRSLSFLLFSTRCNPFLLPPPPPKRRSARGPFGVRHLCSVIQSATVLFILDLFGALESLSLIHAKIRHFFPPSFSLFILCLPHF